MNPNTPDAGEPLHPSKERAKPSNLPPGDRVYRKIFPPQREAALKRELEFLQYLGKGEGSNYFPTLLGQGTLGDGSFYLDLEVIPGQNLYQLVATQGPMVSRQAISLLQGILTPLKILHGLGIVHGDLSPGNLFLTEGEKIVVLDFEKARIEGNGPIKGETEGFSGGTHGYAPKEAYLGHPPDHSFDLYGLGGILHFLLVGQIPPLDNEGNFLPTLLRRLRALTPAPLIDLCLRLLSSPDLRPGLEEIDQLLRTIPTPEEEISLLESFLLGGPEPSPPISKDLGEAFSQEIQRRRHWGRKLNDLLEKLPQTPPELPPKDRLMGAWDFARVIKICLSHLPLLPLARERLSRASQRIPDLLKELPESFRQLREDLQFAEAKYLARLSINLCEILAGIPIAHPQGPRLIAKTSKTLHASYKRMEHEEKRVRECEKAFMEALGFMDFDGARKALNTIGEYWSGANPTLARLRDRLHRAEWLANRILQGREAFISGLNIIGERTPSSTETFKLMESLESINPTRESPRSYGINRLARTLMDYGEAFPMRGNKEEGKGRPDLQQVFLEVQNLRRELTRLCHHYAQRMEDYLQMDPIPLRPILKDLAEADRILFLDCLVDLEEKTRGGLYDQLDGLRIRIEALADEGHWLSARAKDQAKRGKLTTALYDMERALKASRGEEDWEPLLSEVERIKQLKQSITEANKRNQELAAQHQRLLQENASPAAIQDCLDKREAVLSFLASNDPGAKERWQQTLATLQRSRAEAACSDLEERFHKATSPQEKLSICISFFQSIEDLQAGSIPERILARWKSFQASAEKELVQMEKACNKKRILRRVLLVGLAMIVALLGLLVFPLL